MFNCTICQFSLVRRESNSGAYFAGMFRVAHVEFIPEYRQEESQEFVSMANKIQHVVRLNVTLFLKIPYCGKVTLQIFSNNSMYLSPVNELPRSEMKVLLLLLLLAPLSINKPSVISQRTQYL